MKIERYTFGMGDRFGQEGEAQLGAVLEANRRGLPVHPVWNKSNREHTLIGTVPASLRAEADAAVRALGWTRPYYVDADHINLKTVDGFVACSNFFTIDVADFVGRSAPAPDIDAFIDAHRHLCGRLEVAGLPAPLAITEAALRAAASTYLLAMQEAGRIYRRICERKGNQDFVVEVSVDEAETPQGPRELLSILAMLAAERVPVQTIAPKFTGRFNKGVDYVGDLVQFEREFEADLCVVAQAVRTFGLPDTLKLSVHSGSDKFSLYPIIHRQIQRHRAGLHVKTAGTTWLEEVIGLARAGDEGLAIARDIYRGAYEKYDDLTAPYRTVIDIDRTTLPTPDQVEGWAGTRFAETLSHNQQHPSYHPGFRQLVHVGFKVAAHMGPRFTQALVTHRKTIAALVAENLLERHLMPIFSSPGSPEGR